ncbi:hypothetical protein ACQ4PT_007016 [Festuca glaucescens]
MRVLQKIGASNQPIRNLSAYIQWMANHNASQDAACASGSSQQGESALGPTVKIEPDVSSARVVPLHSNGSPAQKATCSPTRTVSIPNLMWDIAKRLCQILSLVWDIAKRLCQIVSLSRIVGVQTPPTLARALRATASPQMVALGALEFDKVFMIYVYLAGKKIEDVSELHEEYIRSLNSMQMEKFESDIWHKFGHKFIAETDRRKNLDWDPSKASVYHCSIEKADDSVVTIFKGPYREKKRNKLQKVVGDDNVLIVNFSDILGHRNVGANIDTYYSSYIQFAKDGIMLGLRRYLFLVYKDGGKEKKRKKEGNQKFSSSVKCYFVRTESGWDRDEPYILSSRTIDEIRKMFMHIHTAPTVAKYVSRFSLVLSKTTTLLDANGLSSVKVITIDDVPCKDKRGNIIINHGEALIHTDGTGLISEDLAKKCPSSVFTGNLSRTDDLQPLLMQIRMFYDGLAVKGTLLVDRRLHCGTIVIRPSMIKVTPDPNLLDGQSFNSLEIVAISNHPRRAYTNRFLITLLNYGGVPVDYFLELLGKARKDVEKACHQTSDSLEVAYNHAYKDDSMSAWMILSGIKPEDDAYLQYQLSEMIREEREGMKLGRISIDDSYYLMGTTDPTGTLKPNEVCVIHYVKSTAADCWLVHMDQLLTSEVQESQHEQEMIKTKMLDLVDIYYEALDAPKTGNKIDVPRALRVKEYPHYMEREKFPSYHSSSVLGKIYDEAKAMAEQSENIPAINISVLSCFTEEVVTKECREQWASRYKDYRRESSALYDDAKYSQEERNARFPEIYQKYRRMLYHAEEFDNSRRSCNEVFGEACVIYQIVYEYALQQKNVRLCGFVWKVAGRALCKLHAIKRGGETVLCSHSVLRDAFKKNR